MKSWWIRFLAVTGCLTFVFVALPHFLIIVFFFPPLGILLAVMPTIFAYALAVTLIYMLLWRVEKMRVPIAVAIAALIVYATPFFFNQLLAQKARQLVVDDLTTQFTIRPNDTITLQVPDLGLNGQNTNKCKHLCQRLLFNGAFENVIVKAHRWNSGYKFYIEKKAACPFIKNILESVSLRIAAGECLIRDVAVSGEGDTIYRDQTGEKSSGTRIRRLELFDKSAGPDQPLHRATQVQVEPFKYPLMYVLSGSSLSDLGFDFARDKYFINRFGKTLEKEHFEIFGQAVAIPKPGTKSRKDLILAAFADNGSDKLAGHFLFEQFLQELYEKKKPPSGNDVKLIVAALKDNRIDDLSNLRPITKFMKSAPDAYVQALANRTLRKPNFGTASAIRELPKGAAAKIFPQLVQIVENKTLRTTASAVTSRLSDAGVVALPIYVAMLEEHRAVMAEPDTKDQRKKIEALKGITNGALVGLCYLREDALSAKDLVISLVSETNPNLYRSRFAVSALIQMGQTSILEQRFEANEALWFSIQKTIEARERLIKANREFCGTL